MKSIIFLMYLAVLTLMVGCDRTQTGPAFPNSGAVKTQPESATLNTEQIKKLAPIILENTLEQERTRAIITKDRPPWVLLQTTQTTPRDLDIEVKRLFARTFGAIYLNEKEIPPDQVWIGENGVKQAYKDGFQFSYKIEFIKENTIKIHYHNWKGMLAGNAQTIEYNWAIGRKEWDLVHASRKIVS